MKANINYYHITLAEIAYWYLLKKRKSLTTGNLFSVMEQICKRLDLINKNKKEKIIQFTDGHCKITEI